MNNYEAILKMTPKQMETFLDQVYLTGMNNGLYMARLDDDEAVDFDPECYTMDWLLSEDPLPEDLPEPEKEKKEETVLHIPPQADGYDAQTKRYTAPDWTERLPGFLRRIFLRWGWLAGVYVAVGGGSIMGIGALIKLACGIMARNVTAFKCQTAEKYQIIPGISGQQCVHARCLSLVSVT